MPPAPKVRSRVPPGRAPVRRSGAAALFVATVVMLAAPAVRAEICKYADPDGNIPYSTVAPEKSWKKLSCTIGDDATQRRAGANGSAARTPTPAGFPRVDAGTQKGRDDVRRTVLTEELAAEEKLLAETRAAYADGAPVPLAEERADAEKYRVRIGKLRQAVAVHEKNVEALKKELGSVK